MVQTRQTDSGANFATNREIRKDAKGWVKNLAIDEEMAEDFGMAHPFQFWFRPAVIRERIAVSYSKQQVLGMSHAYQLYEGTSNTPVSFDLWVNRLVMMKEHMLNTDRGTGQSGDTDTQEDRDHLLVELSQQIERGKKYLQALSVPPEQASGVIGGAPPACLLVIPGILSLRMRLINLDFTHSDVDVRGNIVELGAKVTFEEAPDSRYTMQDVLESGSHRTWGLV
jgi:hypothetical protein